MLGLFLMFGTTRLLSSAPIAPAPPRLQVDCTVVPEAHTLRVDVTTPVQVGWLNDRQVTFRLAKAMSKPVVSLQDGGKLVHLELTAEAIGTDLSYTAQLPSNPSPSAQLEFAYESVVRDAFVFHVGPEGTFAGGYNTTWYPVFGDRRSVGRMTFTVPDGYVVKASGKQIAGTKTPFAFDIENPTVLTFAIAKYTVRRIEGRVPMTLYLLHEHPAAAQYAEGCSKILTVLQRAFGPYPYPDFRDHRDAGAGFADGRLLWGLVRGLYVRRQRRDEPAIRPGVLRP